MSYKALYRKYRSQDFDELVGQDAVVKTLMNALKKGKISHAYLFSGPRGTGKTSVARLFAKALNCRDGIGNICNSCPSCLEINENKHPDVIEIDAASNSGVDEVRNLIEKVKYSPIEGRYKVYIIDEVHMMTTSAFNALLKTLEEPPSYVVFILCTTEPYKLLPTIISRCQRYEFKKIKDEDLAKLINGVLDKERVSATTEAVNLIIELANGGARDALSILDQIIAYSGTKITEEDIEKVFGLTSSEEKINLLKLIKKNDTLNVLNTYHEFIKRNVDVSRFINETLNLLKDALIYLKTLNKDLLTSTNLEKIIQLCNLLNEDEVNAYINLFMECNKELKSSANPLFTFEIYLLKLCSYKKEIVNNVPLKDVKAQPQVQEQTFINKSYVQPTPKVQVSNSFQENKPLGDLLKPEVKETPVKPKRTKTVVQKPSNLTKNPAERDLKLINLDSTGTSYFIDEDNLIKLLSVAKKDLRSAIAATWPDLENYIDDKKYGPIATILIDSSIFAVSEKHIIIVNNYDIATKKVNICKNQELFSELIEKISGNKLFVYSLNRGRYIDIKSKFLNLQQVNKIPTCEDINEVIVSTEEVE